MALIRAALIISGFAAAALPLANLYAMPELVPVFLVSGLTGALTGLQNPHVTLVTKALRFGPLAAAQLAQRFFGLTLAIALAVVFRSYWAIIAGNFLGALAAAVLTYRLVPYRPRLCLSHVREIWSFSGWIFFKQIIETVNWRIDQVIIGAVVTKPQLGIYAMADSLAVIPSRETVQPLRQTLFPGLAHLSEDISRLRKASVLAQSTLAMAVAPLGIGLVVVAEPAVWVFLGEKWMAAVPYVQIAALLYAFGTFSIALQPIAMALGRTKILFVQQTTVLLIKVPLLVAGLHYGGLVGAASARCFAEFVSMFLEMLATKLLTGVSIKTQMWSHATTILALVSMSIGLHVLQTLLAGYSAGATLQLAIGIPAGGALYIATIAVVWLASGRPVGPVSELLGVAERIRHVIRASARATDEDGKVGRQTHA